MLESFLDAMRLVREFYLDGFLAGYEQSEQLLFSILPAPVADRAPQSFYTLRSASCGQCRHCHGACHPISMILSPATCPARGWTGPHP